MSAAGPLSNVLLAVIAFLVLKSLVWAGLAVHESRGFHPFMIVWPTDDAYGNGMIACIKMASTFLFLNVLLALINIVPLPPFDGAGVVEGLLPRQTGSFYQMVRGQFVFVIMALVLVYYLLNETFFPIMQWISDQI